MMESASVSTSLEAPEAQLKKDILQRYRCTERTKSADDLSRGATVEALTEVIMEHRGTKQDMAPPSPTEYFSCIMTALPGPQNDQHIPLMFLLSVVLTALPKGVVRLKGEETLKLVLSILQRENDRGNTEDFRLIRYCLTLLGLLIAAQEPSSATWEKVTFNRGFGVLLGTIADSRPKVRKVAQHSVSLILEEHGVCPTPAETLCHLACDVLGKASISDITNASRLVWFLQNTAPFITESAKSSKKILRLFRVLLDLIRLGQPTLFVNALNAVELMSRHTRDNRFWKPEKKFSMMESIVVAFTNVLSDLQGSKFICADPNMCSIYIESLQKSERNIFDFTQEEKLPVKSQLPKVLQTLLSVMTAGLGQAVEKGAAPTGMPQVALPVGAMCQLLKLETSAIENDPEVLSQVLLELEPLLTPKFEDSWSLSLEVFRQYFLSKTLVGRNKLVEDREMEWIRKLASVRESVINPVTGADKPKLVIRWRPSIERVVGAAIGALGVARVLRTLPLNNNATNSGVAPIRAWLLPVLRQNIGTTGVAQPSLQYFRTDILKSAEECERLAADSTLGPNSAKLQRTKCIQLWSLFPGFCTQTCDVSTALPPLAPILASALTDTRFPELTEYICLGLEVLIGEESNKPTLAGLSRQFLPILFNLYDTLTCENATDRAAFIHRLIKAYATCAPSDVLNQMFRKLAQELILASTNVNSSSAKKKRTTVGTETKTTSMQDDNSSSDSEDDDDEDDDDEEDVMDTADIDQERRKIHILCSLSMAMIPALDTESVDMLFRIIEPFLDDEDDQILQKRGYQVLECICSNQIKWVLGKRQQLQELLQTAFFSVSTSAKTARLRCLSHIFNALQHELSDLSTVTVSKIVVEIIGEVVLSIKEGNKKARNEAYKLLIVIGDTLDKVYGSDEGIVTYMNILVAGLAAKTPHMRSATINALSRAYGEYGMRCGSSEALECSIIETSQAVLLLLSEKSREVATSGIRFAKVCAIRLPVETVNKLLPDILKSLLPWANDTKNRFSTKVRVIFERLTKRVGAEAILNVGVIPSDHKLLVYIRKHNAYKRRRYERKRNGEPVGAEALGLSTFKGKKKSGNSREPDSSDDELSSEDDRKSRKSRGRKHRNMAGEVNLAEQDIVMDEGGDAIDLLGSSALGKVKRRTEGNTTNKKEGDDENDGFKVSKDGRIIVQEEEGDDGSGEGNDDDMDVDGKFKKRKRRKNYLSSDDEDETQQQAKKKENANKKKKVGQEYKSKKAGGDVKKKGKFEPYAYIKLDPKMLNKRRKHESARQFRGLSGKKFQERGAGKRAKNNNSRKERRNNKKN